MRRFLVDWWVEFRGIGVYQSGTLYLCGFSPVRSGASPTKTYTETGVLVSMEDGGAVTDLNGNIRFLQKHQSNDALLGYADIAKSLEARNVE